MLTSINLPQSLILIILSCISSTSLVVLLNGKSSDYFEPSRGIRQGDPLLPYLFILGMKFLSMLIHNQVISGNWKPIKITKSRPQISHTLFTEDVFLFAEVTIENALSISSVLDFFYLF